MVFLIFKVLTCNKLIIFYFFYVMIFLKKKSFRKKFIDGLCELTYTKFNIMS